MRREYRTSVSYALKSKREETKTQRKKKKENKKKEEDRKGRNP